ncbi:hypothetical protein HGRIS_001250 [Hohenbuehelia grisea]|uniref:Uncharacterized protein n=1 Tax=Hohenbuehelia grisea TaxID=104357 RepID=A0ABR3JNQ4_9AGAR
MPPAHHLYDLFPFSLIVMCLTKRGKELKGKKGARLRARLRNKTLSHNIPLKSRRISIGHEPFQVFQEDSRVAIDTWYCHSRQLFFLLYLRDSEEIENPFGYDKNNLNLDHFTHNIIRNELDAITSTPAPYPARWIFSPQNDLVFASSVDEDVERLPPDQWVKRGAAKM